MSQLFSDTDEQAVQDIINPWEKGNSGDESNRVNVASETESIKKKKKNGMASLKCWGKNTCHPSILYLKKISSKNKDQKEIFSNWNWENLSSANLY